MQTLLRKGELKHAVEKNKVVVTLPYRFMDEQGDFKFALEEPPKPRAMALSSIHDDQNLKMPDATLAWSHQVGPAYATLAEIKQDFGGHQVRCWSSFFACRAA